MGGGVDTWKEPRAQRQWTKWRGLELAWVIQMDSDGLAKEEEQVSINVAFQYFYLVARSRVML